MSADARLEKFYSCSLEANEPRVATPYAGHADMAVTPSNESVPKRCSVKGVRFTSLRCDSAALLLPSILDTLTLRFLFSRVDPVHLTSGLPERLLGWVDEAGVRRSKNP